ncbi:MAG: flagellar biosynthesis protein FlhF, partial [Candidatus Competibacteraceae bacterium]|nr:flagellar biosynthesis protein FlhF [Candidatus Competibacteraceae bacterium]
WSQDPMLVQMQQRIDAVYAMLQQQVSGLAWGEMGRRQPQRADLLARLMDFGLSSQLCLELAERVEPGADLEQAWRQALGLLAQALPVADDEILTRGGVVALVGPTGVGKTTTVAKLAARYALRHGPRKVALVTTDSYRIGAYDQLRTFGMILDMPVRLAADHNELERAIQDFSDRELILIDTAGMSQRDLRLSQQFALLNRAEGVKTYLVLTANGLSCAQQEVVGAFSRTPLRGCIVTKLDETTRLGGTLAVIIKAALPLAYTSNGQRVPEDLLTARPEGLVELGAELIREQQSCPDQETLALTFGRRVANGGL